ncbi:MAG: ribosome maturation factor RimM [Betaproteobacteria bacterium]
MMPGLEPAELPADAIEVGRVLDAWGIKGWLKVLPHSATPQALLSSKQWFLLPSERGAKTFDGAIKLDIEVARTHADSVVASARGILDRNGAETLRGARILVSRATFPQPATDEYYWVDLIGLDVLNREGVPLGLVKELLSTAAQTVLVLSQVQDGKTVERMIPFVGIYIDQVDLAARRIVVDWQPDF